MATSTAGHRQLTVWQFLKRRAQAITAAANGVGPFRAYAGEHVERESVCPNYDACLSYAVRANWGNWTCESCRKSASSREILETSNAAAT